MRILYKNLKKYCLGPNLKIGEYLKALDKYGVGFLIIQSESKLLNVITDGDLRREIIAGSSVDEVYSCEGKSCISAFIGEKYEKLKSLIEINKLKVLPLIDKDQKLLAILTNAPAQEDYKGFIMAGGEGKRLRPLTSTTPKPLLKIAGKPLIERAIASVSQAGISNIEISINYLADQFEKYFDERDTEISIKLIQEKRKLGTAGSLSLTDQDDKDLLVCNADLVTDFDYIKLVLSSIENDYDLVVGSREFGTVIPFGVLRTKGKFIQEIQEKPEIKSDVAAGIYFLRRKILKLLPNERLYDMPDLINCCLENNLSVGLCPVLGSWIDVGRKEHYDAVVNRNAE